MELSIDLVRNVQDQLNDHFGVHCKRPKIKICGMVKFFEYYTGKRKDWTINELIKLDAESQYFYDDTTNTVVFKNFKRNGLKSFKRLSHQHIKIVDLTHEFIHGIQVQCGGYSNSNFFTEGCCEISAYVLTGTIEIYYSGYGMYVANIWKILDSVTTNPIKKYKEIIRYNTADNKEEVENEWLEQFLNQHTKLHQSIKQLRQQLEEEKDYSPQLTKIFDKMDDLRVIKDLYKVHDQLKPKLSSVFQ